LPGFLALNRCWIALVGAGPLFPAWLADRGGRKAPLDDLDLSWLVDLQFHRRVFARPLLFSCGVFPQPLLGIGHGGGMAGTGRGHCAIAAMGRIPRACLLAGFCKAREYRLPTCPFERGNLGFVWRLISVRCMAVDLACCPAPSRSVLYPLFVKSPSDLGRNRRLQLEKSARLRTPA